MLSSSRWLIRGALSILLALPAAFSNALVLGIPPDIKTDQEVLENFADSLARQLGESVELEVVSNWRLFRVLAQTGKIDLVFGAPHLVAWLAVHETWSPLLRIEDDLHFIVVTNRPADDIFELGDLVGRPVCVPLSPDLGSLILLERFTNRNRQPLRREAVGGRGALASLRDTGCDAVVLIESIYDGTPASESDSLTVLMKSRALGNYGFVSRTKSSKGKSRLREALTSSALHDSIRPLLLEYSDRDGLILPEAGDFSREISGLLNDFWN